MYVCVQPCSGRSSRGKIHVGPRVGWLDLQSTDPTEERQKRRVKAAWKHTESIQEFQRNSKMTVINDNKVCSCWRRGVTSVFCTILHTERYRWITNVQNLVFLLSSESVSKCAFLERVNNGVIFGHLVTLTCHRLKFCSAVVTFPSRLNNQPRQFVIGCRWDETESSCPDVRLSEQPLHKKIV